MAQTGVGVYVSVSASMQTLDGSFKSILPLQNHLVSNLHYATPEPNTTLMGDVAWNSREIHSAKNLLHIRAPFFLPCADPDGGANSEMKICQTWKS